MTSLYPSWYARIHEEALFSPQVGTIWKEIYRHLEGAEKAQKAYYSKWSRPESPSDCSSVELRDSFWHWTAGSLFLALGSNPIDWFNLASAIASHLKIPSDEESGDTLKKTLSVSPNSFVRWIDQRIQDHADLTDADALAAEVLALWVHQQISPASPPLLEWVDNIRDVLLARGLIQSWSFLTYRVLLEPPFGEDRERIEAAWDQFEALTEGEEQKSAYRCRRDLYLVSQESDHHSSAESCHVSLEKHRDIEKIVIDALSKGESTTVQRQFAFFLLQWRHEWAFRLLCLDKIPESVKQLEEALNIGIMLTPQNDSVVGEIPGWRAEMLSICADGRHIARWLAYDHPFAQRSQIWFAEHLHSEKSGAYRQATRLVDEASRLSISGKHDEAKKKAFEAVSRFIRLRTFVGIMSARRTLARIHMQEGLFFYFQNEGASAALDSFVKSIRRATSGGDHETVKSVKEIMDASPLRISEDSQNEFTRLVDLPRISRFEKTAYCKTLLYIVDFLSDRAAEKAFSDLCEYVLEPWAMDSSIDVSRSALKALGAFIRIVPALSNPEKKLMQIVDTCEKAIVKHRAPLVINQVSEVAQILFEELSSLPLLETVAEPLLQLNKRFDWKPGMIVDRAWCNLTWPALFLSMKGKTVDWKTLSESIPPFPIEGNDFQPSHSTKSTVEETALLYRCVANLEIKEDVLLRYIESKKKELSEMYLSEHKRFAYPGRFDNFVACARVTTGDIRRSILFTTLKIALREEVLPVLREEALHSLISLWVRHPRKDAKEPMTNVLELLEIENDLIMTLLEKIRLWAAQDRKVEREYFIDPGSPIRAAWAASQLLLEMLLLLPSDLQQITPALKPWDYYLTLRDTVNVKSLETAQMISSFAAFVLGRGFGLEDRNLNEVASRDVLSFLIRPTEVIARAGVVGSIANGLLRRDITTSSIELDSVVRAIINFAEGPQSDLRNAAIRVLVNYNRATERKNTQLGIEIDSILTSLLNGIPAERAGVIIAEMESEN